MSFTDYKKVGKDYGVQGGDFMELKDGDNKVRFVTEFVPYGNHFNEKLQKSIICVGKEDCSECQKDNKPRVQFIGWVIDRADGDIKLLRIGYQIYSDMGKLSESDDFAFDKLPGYDVTINRTGEKLQTKYNVVPARNDTELTQEEKFALVDKIKEPQEIVDAMKAKVVPESSEDEEPRFPPSEPRPEFTG